MSSSTGIQNLLVNVFRPVYTYDSNTGGFIPSLQLANVAYSGTTISASNLSIGDGNQNVYVGSNAGNSYLETRGCDNNTTLGFSAGGFISNVSNSVYLGYNAGNGTSNASNVIAIGYNAGGDGNNNIFLGSDTGSLGSNNILIGHGITENGSNNLLRIGSTIYGNLSNRWIGIGTDTPLDVDTRLDVSGDAHVSGILSAGAFDISSGAISSSNLVVSGYLRNNVVPTQFDISGGNISNSGTSFSGTFTTVNALTSNRIGGVILESSNIATSGNLTIGNVVASGYLRNALTPTQFDISGGNISNSGSNTTNTLITRNLYAPSTTDISAISYINMGTGQNGGTGGPASNLQFLWLRGGGAPLRYAGINFGNYNTSSFMTYNDNGRLVTKFIGDLPSAQSQLDACQSLFTITSGGNVGVGTVSPGSALQVSTSPDFPHPNNPLASNGMTLFGSARASPTYAGTSDLNGTLWVSSTNAVANQTGASIALGGRSTDFGGGQLHMTWGRITGVTPTGSYNGNLVFETNAGGTLFERMRIDSNGNVGIGTPPNNLAWTPQNVRLDVSGGAIRNIASSLPASQVTITGGTDETSAPTAAGADFTKTYDQNLATLWNPSVAGGYSYRFNYTWALSTIGRIRLIFNNSSPHPPTLVQIFTDSGRTNKVYDSGTLTSGSFFALGSYAFLDAQLTVPTTCTQLWFSMTGGAFQTLTQEIQPFAVSSTGPEYIAHDVTAPPSNRSWSEYYSSSNAYWRLADDTGTNTSNWLNVTRSNLTTSAIRFSLGTTSNIERVTMLANGNVGIGTPTPVATLDISSTVAGAMVQNGGLFLRGRPGWGQLHLYNNAANNAIIIEDASSTIVRAVDNFPSSGPTGWRLGTDSNYQSGSAFALNRVNNAGSSQLNVMTVLSGGNVGIGTTTPVAKLTLNGAEATNAIVLTNGSGNDQTRPVTAALVSNEICGLSSMTVNGQGADAGQLRLSAGGGFDVTAKSFIDLYGYSTFGINLGTRGATRMTINGAGNVGIGTTNPSATLDVSGNFKVALANALFDVTPVVGSYGNVTMNGYFGIYRPGTTNKAASNQVVSFSPEAGSPHYLLSNNVGIGTRAPTTTLDISSNNGTAGSVRITNTSTVSNTRVLDALMPNIPNGGKSQILLGKNIADTNNFGNLSYTHVTDGSTSNYIGFGKSTGDGLIVNQFGNVGIGTTAPQALLDVSGTNRVLTLTASSTTSPSPIMVTFQPNLTTTSPSNYMYRFFGVNNSASNAFGEIFTYVGSGNASNSYRMYMQGMATGGITMVANGNVGIGTTNPGYTLDVSAGTTTASVNMTSWPRTAANTLIVVGNVGFTGSVANWSNASTSMSTSLLTFVASNATTGGYFTILKSGIWSVKCVMTNNDINGRASIDASTNISNTANFPFGAIAQTTSGYWGDLNYTGYLSSNATMYYKVMSIGNPSPSVGKAVKLIVTFISEMPDITPVFPLI